MKVPVDLHIHSCLSPCADDDMTPNNIAGMAQIAGIAIIAVTDHNNAANLPAVAKCAEAYGVGLLPGIEVTTREDTHCLCYFGDVEAAVRFGATCESRLTNILNVPKLFGNQYIMNEDDEVVGSVEKLLINSTSFSIDELHRECHAVGGVVVPAHINRGGNGILQTLGFLPKSPRFAALEVSRTAPAPLCDLLGYHILNSSDAHRLTAMTEPAQYLDLEGASVSALFGLLKRWEG